MRAFSQMYLSLFLSVQGSAWDCSHVAPSCLGDAGFLLEGCCQFGAELTQLFHLVCCRHFICCRMNPTHMGKVIRKVC